MTRRRKSPEVSGGECILLTFSWNGNVAVSVICKWFMLDVVQLVELLIRKVGSFPGRGIDRVVIRHRMIVFSV